MSLGDQLIDASLADRDDRELRRDEKTVGKDQNRHGGQSPQNLRQRVLHRQILVARHWDRYRGFRAAARSARTLDEKSDQFVCDRGRHATA